MFALVAVVVVVVISRCCCCCCCRCCRRSCCCCCCCCCCCRCCSLFPLYYTGNFFCRNLTKNKTSLKNKSGNEKSSYRYMTLKLDSSKLTTVLRGTIVNTRYDQMLLVKVAKCWGFRVHRRSYLVFNMAPVK